MTIQFDLTEDQELFQETTVRFIEAELPRERTRALHHHPAGFDRGWLAKSAELGWFSMLVPEEYGGGSVSGRPVMDAALVAEELGRQVQPGPFIPMNVALAALARHASDHLRYEVVPAAVAGQSIVTWAFSDEHGGWDGGAGVTLSESDDGYELTGVRGMVQDAVQAAWLLVPATYGDRCVQVLVRGAAGGVSQEPLLRLDLSRRFSNITFDRVRIGFDALLDSGEGALDDQLAMAVTLSAAETVGAMDELFAMTVAYSKDRIAFGRPIGSFQALKHLMADLALGLETAKAAVSAAIDALDSGDDSATEVVSMTGAFVGEQGNETAQQCLQIHGGIGYTWEHDLHLLMRRIQTNSALYGTPTWHRERVCTFHGLGAGTAR